MNYSQFYKVQPCSSMVFYHHKLELNFSIENERFLISAENQLKFTNFSELVHCAEFQNY